MSGGLVATKESYLKRAAKLRVVAAEVNDSVAETIIGALITALEEAAAEAFIPEEATADRGKN